MPLLSGSLLVDIRIPSHYDDLQLRRVYSSVPQRA